MSVHIAAKQGEIADVVLLPGDPLRAKYIAEKYLEDVVQYNSVRNMFGFTGTYKGKRISVQGTGMGLPSIMIYANELITEFGVKTLIRVGSAGSIQHDVKVRDIVLAQGATTDSSVFQNIFNHQVNFAALANFKLLDKVYHTGINRNNATIHVGNILSSERFYNAELNTKKLSEYGVLAIEMEAAGLYALAAQHHVDALTMLTISDHILTGEETTSLEREQTFTEMMEIALEAVLD